MKRLNNDKKWGILKLIGGVMFLAIGAIFGLIALACYEWNFVTFITNPTIDLVLLCLVAIGVFLLASKEIR